VIPPGDEMAVYEIMTEPPLLAGGAKLTVALYLPVPRAVIDVGAPGTMIIGGHVFVFPPSPASERFVFDKLVPQY
jgi:hypothetical protein